MGDTSGNSSGSSSGGTSGKIPTMKLTVTGTETLTHKIEALEGASNYPIWRIRVEDVLCEIGYWGWVTGTTTVDNVEASQQDLWRTIDRRALSYIRGKCKEEPTMWIIGAKSARECWQLISDRLYRICA